MNSRNIVDLAIEQGGGILHLEPNWVPRSYSTPGKRLKLHPDDYYALGANRGSIDERWLSSTVLADNGPLTPPNEGLSNVVFRDGDRIQKIFLRDAVEKLKGQLIGDDIWNQYHSLPVFAKFFDNVDAIAFHLHHRHQHAMMIGKSEKPEAYYFPPQLNAYTGNFPYTFFGLQSHVTRQQFLERMLNFGRCDNHITELSTAYRLILGTAWDVPAGILHAPGSLCTYEPQWASDIGAVYQSLVGGQLVRSSMLWSALPPEHVDDFELLVDLIDWEANTDPDFSTHSFMQPIPAIPPEQSLTAGFIENWIVYKTQLFAAKELSINPGKTVTITDDAAYGVIVVQGHGKIGNWDVEAPTMLRYGQISNDEFFVSHMAAQLGIVVSNHSATEPLVMLKHFGPNHTALNCA